MKDKLKVGTLVLLLLFTMYAPVVAYERSDEIGVSKTIQAQFEEFANTTKVKSAENTDSSSEIQGEEVGEVEQITPDMTNYLGSNGLPVMVNGEEIDFYNAGVINMYGLTYTWYSSKVLYHYKTSEWYACNDGLYRTVDGYIVCASSDYSYGTIIDTPFGKGQILDSGCASGVVDVYVNY